MEYLTTTERRNKRMKTNTLFLLALSGVLFFTACASEDTAKQEPTQEPGIEGLTAFVVGDSDTETRTTAEYDGSGINFYWTAGDRLWVNNVTLKRDVRNTINNHLENHPTMPTTAVKRVATAKFYFTGNFTAASYPVRYTGKNGVANKVTIKDAQSQTVPNDASHIATDGDFGVATAAKYAGSGQYRFTLDHKASYITFAPYTSQGIISGAKIQKIRIFTDNASDVLAGTFDLADDGTLSNPTSTSNSVELVINDFSIPSTYAYATNAAIMVVNPGTYSNVSIEYTLHDPVTNVTGTITKTYPSLTFTAGKNKKVKADLQVIEYPANRYYTWDAAEGQHYWKGYEWDNPNPSLRHQPTINWASNPTYAPGFGPESGSNPRGYRDDTFTPLPITTPAIRSAKDCPNVNECIWYAMEGNPHYEQSTLWATMGHLYTGGTWIKKLSVIGNSQHPKKTLAELKAAAPNGIDYRTPQPWSNFINYNLVQGKKPSNLSDYFFIPHLGQYLNGGLSGVGHLSYIWSNTSTPMGESGAFCFGISGSDAQVFRTNRGNGTLLLKTDDNDNQYRPNGL